jgi:hypothetical protein
VQILVHVFPLSSLLDVHVGMFVCLHFPVTAGLRCLRLWKLVSYGQSSCPNAPGLGPLPSIANVDDSMLVTSCHLYPLGFSSRALTPRLKSEWFAFAAKKRLGYAEDATYYISISDSCL